MEYDRLQDLLGGLDDDAAAFRAPYEPATLDDDSEELDHICDDNRLTATAGLGSF